MNTAERTDDAEQPRRFKIKKYLKNYKITLDNTAEIGYNL